MNVGELCNRDVVCAEGQASAAEIAKLMREYHVGSIVITKTQKTVRKPVGIVTDRDIVTELVAKGVSADTCTASDIMNLDLTAVNAKEDVYSCLETMRSKGIRRMPVIDDQGALVGIVTADDVLDFIREQLSEVVALIYREQENEKRRRH
jgi:CBS domain-containing protein